MADIWTIISSVSSTVGVIAGTSAVAYQLHKQRRWHIQHSTLETAKQFVGGEIFQHWLKVRNQLITKSKLFEEITEEEQKSVISLLSYFENIGVMYKHNILDMGIIYDSFSVAIYELYKYTSSFLPEYRKQRANPSVYKEFEDLALALQERTEKDLRQWQLVAMPTSPSLELVKDQILPLATKVAADDQKE